MTLVLPALWAMQPDALTALADALRRHPAGPSVPRTDPGEEPAPYALRDGLAIVSVRGPLSKEGLHFGSLRLLDSMRRLAAALGAAAADPAVRAILLDVDSPGGTVDGIEELAEAVQHAAAARPLYAFADGLMASAAYWLSAGAREIAAPATAQVGSIGVVSLHREISRALDTSGVTCTVLTAGHYKAAGNPVEPLSDEMRAYLQSGIDAVYELFLSAVERGRGVSREKALGMADGRIFIAGEALKAGLIDRVCSREAFIHHIKESTFMDLAELRAAHPELEDALRAELEQGQAAAIEAARKQAANDERDRLLALADAVLGADADRLTAVVRSGITPEQLTALRPLLKPQGASDDPYRDAALKTLAEAAARPLDSLSGPVAENDFTALVRAEMERSGATRGQAMAEVARRHPKAHAAWLAAMQKEEA
ncbi:S49 family peptidase [uncultured Desulfovibrio sp.]|uniref:S49 family peptidase n=1 Tax=uncultured Desulfovibrio sp. TaxID=167968 RepID=UPI002639D615|nr:S49 family peptidase [uncultured Desulfovibrio sp.]